MNPRGTFWAPIRFRVGRLQPGSATPPHQYRQQFIAYLTVRAECLQLRSLSLVEVPPRSRCSGRPWRAPVRFSRRLLQVSRATGAGTTEPCSTFASRPALGPFASLPQQRRDAKRTCGAERVLRHAVDTTSVIVLGGCAESGQNCESSSRVAGAAGAAPCLTSWMRTPRVTRIARAGRRCQGNCWCSAPGCPQRDHRRRASCRLSILPPRHPQGH